MTTSMQISAALTFCALQVAFIKAIRAKRYDSNIPPHAFTYKHNAADPSERILGTQVLLDILLLAKCDHLLLAESSVAALASYFNPRMKSYFMDGKILKVPFCPLKVTVEKRI